MQKAWKHLALMNGAFREFADDTHTQARTLAHMHGLPLYGWHVDKELGRTWSEESLCPGREAGGGGGGGLSA